MFYIQAFLKFVFLFIVSILSISVFAKQKPVNNSEREKAAQAFLRAHDHSKNLHTFYTKNDWQVLELAKVERALKVPSQVHGHKDLSTWSCGPNSAARSFELLGIDICSSHKKCDPSSHSSYAKEYKHFAENFPKSFGYPGTRSGSVTSLSVTAAGLYGLLGHGYGGPVVKVAMASAVVLAGLSPYLLGYFGGNVGAIPQWYAAHIKQILGLKDLGVQQIVKHKFADMLVEIKNSIQKQVPVIPLVVFDLTAWHYFVIIGYNDQSSEVLVMDTDSTVAVYSYHHLERLMNPGYLADDDMATYMLASLVSTASKLGTYNLITFTHHALTKTAP